MIRPSHRSNRVPRWRPWAVLAVLSLAAGCSSAGEDDELAAGAERSGKLDALRFASRHGAGYGRGAWCGLGAG